LATLSVISAPELLEAYFSFRHSWASPFRAFLLHRDPPDVSTRSIRPCASFRNLTGLGSALRRLEPPMEAVPLCATGWIRSGQGPCLSWALGPLRLSVRRSGPSGISPVEQPPRHWLLSPLARRTRPTLGALPRNGPAFSLTGRRPVWPFCRSALAVSSKPKPPADYFFLSRFLSPLRDPRVLSLRATRSFLSVDREPCNFIDREVRLPLAFAFRFLFKLGLAFHSVLAGFRFFFGLAKNGER
jgi:hypothetical protein